MERKVLHMKYRQKLLYLIDGLITKNKINYEITYI